MSFVRSLALAAILPALSVVGLSDSGWTQESPDAELWTFLREAHSEEAAVLGQRIAAQGPTMALPLFLALRDETCPLPDKGALIIGPVEETVLLRGVHELGRHSFAQLFAKGAPVGLDPDTRRALLQVLAEVGKADDAGVVFELVAEAAPSDARIVSTFEAAVTGIVGRDFRALGTLRTRFLDLDEEFACATARAVANRPSHAGVELLVEMIGYREALTPVLLSQATKAARELEGPFDEALRAKARLSLTDPDFQILRQAAKTVAVLEDFEATETLIELLEHDQRGVRDSAHWALRELTGLQLRADATGWLSWYEGELRWYQEEAPLLRRMLAHGTNIQILEALPALARHRYDRHVTALAVAEILQHDNPLLRQRACVVLRQLDSRAPLAALVECLEDEKDVASEAHRTLQALTGQDLPLDYAAWHAALGFDESSS